MPHFRKQKKTGYCLAYEWGYTYNNSGWNSLQLPPWSFLRRDVTYFFSSLVNHPKMTAARWIIQTQPMIFPANLWLGFSMAMLNNQMVYIYIIDIITRDFPGLLVLGLFSKKEGSCESCLRKAASDITSTWWYLNGDDGKSNAWVLSIQTASFHGQFLLKRSPHEFWQANNPA